MHLSNTPKSTCNKFAGSPPCQRVTQLNSFRYITDSLFFVFLAKFSNSALLFCSFICCGLRVIMFLVVARIYSNDLFLAQPREAPFLPSFCVLSFQFESSRAVISELFFTRTILSFCAVFVYRQSYEMSVES